MVKPNKDNIDEKNDDSENEEMNLSDSDSEFVFCYWEGI